jgi:hypothetical protein
LGLPPSEPAKLVRHTGVDPVPPISIPRTPFLHIQDPMPNGITSCPMGVSYAHHTHLPNHPLSSMSTFCVLHPTISVPPFHPVVPLVPPSSLTHPSFFAHSRLSCQPNVPPINQILILLFLFSHISRVRLTLSAQFTSLLHLVGPQYTSFSPGSWTLQLLVEPEKQQ